MEPKLPAPHGSPETGPTVPSPELPIQQGGEVQHGYERGEVHEQKSTNDGSGPVPLVMPIAAPVIFPQPPIAQPPAIPVNDNPAVAADDDIIEKEWVEKAKKVIAETRHDPYLQEQAVSRLQADYLNKRYGKTVKLPEEG